VTKQSRKQPMATESTEKPSTVIPLLDRGIQIKKPNYNYHREEHEGHEGLQMEQPGCGMWDVEAANNSQNIYVCRFSSFQVDSHDINRRCEERSDEAIQKTANGHGIHRKTFHRHPAT